MRAPILFLVFNRPETTRQVFAAIREAQPERLYVAADGPRRGKPGEMEKCDAVRSIVGEVDWPCDVKTLFREVNLGCKRAVSSGITWFFENEEEGIILEDDVLPDPSFFPFCEELLARYREDNRVVMISGDYFHGSRAGLRSSYFFSRYTHIWGWATWRRAWKHYDPDMSQWPTLRNTNFLADACQADGNCARYWREVFDAVYEGRIDTWDYQWLFASFCCSGLSILPNRNLVRNIGFGEGTTHTTDTGSWMANLKSSSMLFPLEHPPTVARDAVRDGWAERNVFGADRSIYGKLRRRIELTLFRRATRFRAE